jgi:hypothetical protein
MLFNLGLKFIKTVDWNKVFHFFSGKDELCHDSLPLSLLIYYTGFCLAEYEQIVNNIKKGQYSAKERGKRRKKLDFSPDVWYNTKRKSAKKARLCV